MTQTLARRQATNRYDHSPKGRAKKARYRSSEHGKRTAAQAAHVWHWNQNYSTLDFGYYEFIKDRLLQCAACDTKDPGSKLGFHTHHTGSKHDGTLNVYGWLCQRCNLSAGQGTVADVARLRSLADWLEAQGG